jgi:outer membrane protein OmpA-like peptidoglycan-associated protein
LGYDSLFLHKTSRMKPFISCAAAFALFVFANNLVAQTKDKDKMTTAAVILDDNDGRFTLGNGDKRLMYGYPMALSTSHFVVKIDTIILTNSPWVAKRKGVHYIKGKTTLEGAYTLKAVTEYQYKKYTIKQTLTPVDKDMKEIVDKNKFAQYYETSIDVTNASGTNAKVGAIILYDAMIDDNDAAIIGTGKQKFKTAQKIMPAQIPLSLQVYKDTANPKAMVAECRPIIGGKKPDELYVGNWPLLQGCTWNVPDESWADYHDSGILLKWKEKDLANAATVQYNSAYGLPGGTLSQLKLVMDAQGIKSKKLAVYFDLGKADLDLNGDMALQNLLGETPNIVGVTLHGFSDASAGSKTAMELSTRRIDMVKKYFDTKKIPVTAKPHGNFDTERNEAVNAKGNVRDRKVVVEVFYK